MVERLTANGRFEWREQALIHKRLPHRDGSRVIDRKNCNGRTANGSLALHDGASPTEMSLPLMPARIKQTDDLSSFAVNARDIWSLAGVTSRASEAQIPEDRSTAVLLCDNMIDGKAKPVRQLRQLAILAALTCPFANTAVERGIHRRSRATTGPFERPTGFRLNNSEHVRNTEILLKLVALVC